MQKNVRINVLKFGMRVKMRKTQNEQMFSAVPPIADILGGRVIQLREDVPFQIRTLGEFLPPHARCVSNPGSRSAKMLAAFCFPDASRKGPQSRGAAPFDRFPRIISPLQSAQSHL